MMHLELLIFQVKSMPHLLKMHHLRQKHITFCVMATLALAGCATPDNAPRQIEEIRPEASIGIQASELDRANKNTTSDLNSSADGEAGSKKEASKNARKIPEPKIFKGTGTFIKPKPDIEKASGGNTALLNFENADIKEVAKTVLADILGQSYVVDPRVQGSISLRTVRPLPNDALLTTLETLLKMNGATMVREEGVYKIIPSNAVRGSVSPRKGGKLSGYSVQIIPLEYVGAREMAKIIEPFAPEGGIIRVDEVRNLLMVGGLQNELAHIMDTVETFDVDWLSGMSVGLFPLQSADVKSIASELDKILGDKSSGPLAGIIRVIPIERLNAFLIITPQPKYLEEAKVWIERLDRSGGMSGGQRLFVYQVQNGKAENLANLLNQAYGGAASTTTSQPRTASSALAPGMAATEIKSSAQAGGVVAPAQAISVPTGETTGNSNTAKTVRIIADKDNNSLLILANSEEYGVIESALRKLDSVPRQVLIDVTIAEVTLTDDLSLGIEWTFDHGTRRTGTLDTGTTGIGALTPGFSYVLRNAAGTGAQAALNMLAQDKRVNVLSSPHIMVADNQQAKIQVGDSVPTVGQTAILSTNSTITTSVQYIDTGIILTVTPRINAGGLVNIEVQQEVSNASTTTTSGLNTPTISKRTAKSLVTVQSGETIVLGGLIQENKTYSTAGIPFLSQIPLIGALFGTQGVSAKKTELVVLITPKIASNVGQAKTLSEEFRKKLGEVTDLLSKHAKETSAD